MKTRNIIFVLSFIFFNSCIVKSLHPFYTKETISFKKELLGEWKDDSGNSWKVTPFKEAFEKENLGKEIDEEDKKMLQKYKFSYYVSFTEKEKEAIFIATPFKINNQYFLDFIPTGFGSMKGVNDLAQVHSVYSHSLVKLDILSKKEVEFRWFDEDELKKLFKENRIKIKHEKTGLMNDEIILTASTEEIQTFLKKYLTTENAKKWETSTEFVLTKS